MSLKRTLLASLLAVGSAGALTISALPAGADAGPHDRAGTTSLVAEIRRATAVYRDVDAALAAGYRPVSPCEHSASGGMGVHYLNPEHAAPGPVDPARPAILLYAADENGALQLAGVEFFQPDVGQGRPMLGGEPFEGPMLGHAPGMPTHYDLHVWTEIANPAGVFAPWNPRVQC